MGKFFEAITIIFAVLAAVIFWPSIIGAAGAPQEAAGAAMGVFLIFTPYAITRIFQASKTIALLEQILKEGKE